VEPPQEPKRARRRRIPKAPRRPPEAESVATEEPSAPAAAPEEAPSANGLAAEATEAAELPQEAVAPAQEAAHVETAPEPEAPAEEVAHAEAPPEAETPAEEAAHAEPAPEPEAPPEEAAHAEPAPAPEAPPEEAAYAKPASEPEAPPEEAAYAEPAPEAEAPPEEAADPEAAPEATTLPLPPPASIAPAPVRVAGGTTLYDLVWATGLPNAGAIASRELRALFVSPIGYVVCALLIIPVSVLGYLGQLAAGQAVTMDLIFSLISLLAVFLTPLYTMRLLAEERRSGTLEVLLTSPVRDWELVIGKWLGGFLFYLVTIAFTLVYVVLISVYQQARTQVPILGLQVQIPAVDYGSILTGYIGVILVGAAWVALGLLASSLTSNQIIAAVVGIVVLLSFQFVFGALSGLFVPPYSDLFDYASAANRAQSFNQGQIALRDVIYFVTVTLGALFVTTRVLESRKWR
jgi:ABC-2 type transport system permease protein